MFSEIQVGQFFQSYTDDLLRKVEEGSVNDWPLANYINVETGLRGSCGPTAPATLVENPEYHQMTDRQHQYLTDLKIDAPKWIGKQAASRMITEAKSKILPGWAVGWCHYCGAPANTFGFFDEPVCRECGG